MSHLRPNRLTFKAFGPFHNETINFDQLKHHKLFLISGKTGAGKTTIFDGMMYALFGTASTSDRNDANLRNINATDAEPTEVIFNFYMQDKQYEIYRDLPFIKTGNKTKKTTQLVVYEITQHEKKLLASGLTAGKEVIQQIVKLDAAQFRKIFILPQGEFKSLLVSDSKDKASILRTLFDTTKIQKLAHSLREKVQNEQKDILKRETELTIQFGLFSDLIELTDDMNNQKKLENIQLSLSELYSTIDSENNTYNKLKSELKIKEEAYQQAKLLNEQIEQHRETEARYKNLIQSEDKIKRQENDIKYLMQLEHYLQVANDLSKSEAKEKSIIKLLKSIDEANDSMTQKHDALKIKLSELNEQQEEMAQKQKYVIQHERYHQPIYARLDQKIAKDEARIQSLTKDVMKLKQLVDEAHIVKVERDAVNKHMNDNELAYKTLESQIVKVKNNQQTLNRILTQLQRMDEHQLQKIKIDQEIQNVKETLKDMHRSEAVQDIDAIQQIKSTLKPGEICPVCAQKVETLDDTTHLEAHAHQLKLEGLISESEQLKTSLSIYLEDLERIPKLINIYTDQDMFVFVNEMDELNKMLDDLTPETVSSVEFQLVVQQLSDIIAQFDKQLERAQDKSDALTHANQKFSERVIILEGKLEKSDELHSVYDDMQFSLEETEKELEASKALKAAFLDDTKTPDYTTFKALFDANKKACETYDAELKSTRQQLEKLEREILSSEKDKASEQAKLQDTIEMIDVLKSRLTQYDIPETIKTEYREKDIAKMIQLFEAEIKTFYTQKVTYTSELKRLESLIDGNARPELEVLKQELLELSNTVDTLYAKINTLKEQHKKYKQHCGTLALCIDEYEKELKAVRSLILLSNALNGNNPQKIDIETYVLMYYLEQTLKLANIRLRQMTGNRYELIRRTEKRGGGKQGLVIDVFDYNANKSRNITSLSGGETFLASLCLALGLSDFVMQISGGIQLESVFVDEGFGTLDNETLEVAINALIDIQTSGKLVGMISHVQLLKERIPALLKIENDGFDSHATFEIK